MVKEGKVRASIAPNIVVKLPSTFDGLKACRALSEEGIRTNMTLCFQPMQAMLVAKAGAFLVSPFIGRLDDISHDGTELIAQIRTIYDNYAIRTRRSSRPRSATPSTCSSAPRSAPMWRRSRSM